MPTYDYRCDACGHAFEQFQSITAASLRKCPDCGKLKLKRLIGTGAGLIFKGAGFYETDYRSDSYKKAAESETPSTDKKTADKKDAPAKSEASTPAPSGGEAKAKPKKSAESA